MKEADELDAAVAEATADKTGVGGRVGTCSQVLENVRGQVHCKGRNVRRKESEARSRDSRPQGGPQHFGGSLYVPATQGEAHRGNTADVRCDWLTHADRNLKVSDAWKKSQ